MCEKVWTLDELRFFSLPIFHLEDEKVRRHLIDLAETKTPSKAQILAARCGDTKSAIKLAKACRYLAIIKRQYGQETFRELISKEVRSKGDGQIIVLGNGC